MKIILPGGSGQVGTMLARVFHERGDEVVVLSRGTAGKVPWRIAEWDASSSGEWEAEIDGADVVINLAGRNVNCRYTPENRRAIMDSRVNSTRAVGRAIAAAKKPPRVWLQASTATIYAHRFDAANDEATGIIGGHEPGVPETWRFSIGVATSWERAVEDAGPLPGTRTVLLRSAVTMSPDKGGPFDVLLGLVRHGLGGTNGNGRQWISWIHEEDFVRAVDWLIEHEICGAVNLSAPEPLPNAEFMRVLRKAWGIGLGLPSTEWMLALGAILLKTETELILKSRRVVPGRLLEGGFEFRFPSWPEAARDLCEKWRKAG